MLPLKHIGEIDFGSDKFIPHHREGLL